MSTSAVRVCDRWAACHYSLVFTLTQAV